MNYKIGCKILQILFLAALGAFMIGCAGKVKSEIRTEIPV